MYGRCNVKLSLYLPRDLIIGQLELGQQNCAVLSSSAVDNTDDLVSPAHGAHQTKIFNGSLHRLNI